MSVINRGVYTLAKSGSSKLYGDITLSGGSNVTLTQSGQDISIAAASGIGGTVGTTDNAIPRADGTGGSTLQGSTGKINDSGGAEFTTNSTTVAPLKLTQSDNTLDTPIIDLNGGTNVVNAEAYSPGLVGDISVAGPQYGGIMHVTGYIKVRLNGVDNEGSGGSSGFYGYYIPTMQEECFTGDTLVKTPEGERRIDSLNIGDTVLSKNFDINEIRPNKIKHFEAHAVTKGYIIINERLKVTQSHRLWANDSWKRAHALEIGDYLRNSKNEKVWIFQLDYKEENCPTYNLIMENQRMANYFADDLLVHNKCPFLYYYDETDLQYPWKCQGTFITEHEGEENRGVHRLTLKNHSNVYYIRELEPEKSYIKSMTLIADGQRLQRISLMPEVIKQGDIIKMIFPKIPEGTKELILESEGYYYYLEK